MVTVTSVSESGVQCVLDEYDEVTGYARLVDMKRVRSVRTLNQITCVGKKEIVEVTDVDVARHTVDVSRNIVSLSEVREFNLKFHRAKKVHDILRYAELKHKRHDVGDQLGWPDFDALLALVTNGLEGVLLPDDVKGTIVAEGDKKLVEDGGVQEMTQNVDLRCSGPGGIESIQKAIRAGMDTDLERTHITLARSPDYTITVQCQDETDGRARIDAAVEAVKTTLESEVGGAFKRLLPGRRLVDDSESLRYGMRPEALLNFLM